MRMINGHACDWNLHFNRMKLAIEYVYGPFIESTDWSLILKERLENLWHQESGNKVIRLTAFLDQERGLQRKKSLAISDLRLHLLASDFDSTLNGKRAKLRSSQAFLRPEWWPPFLKAGHYLESILAQKKYLQEGDDDLLFVSDQNTVLESSIANIFVLLGNDLYTPPSGPNVLAGVMREKVLRHGSEFFKECRENQINLEDLYKAQAVFGSNSVRGIFLIDRIDDHEIKYDQSFCEKFEKLRERVLS